MTIEMMITHIYYQLLVTMVAYLALRALVEMFVYLYLERG